MSGEILNWQDGLSRVVNNKNLYAKLLGRFVDGYADLPDKVAAALADGNVDEARMHAHTLKGTAANLGAEALAATALTLEDALKAGQSADAPLALVRETLAQTLTAMRAFQP